MFRKLTELLKSNGDKDKLPKPYVPNPGIPCGRFRDKDQFQDLYDLQAKSSKLRNEFDHKMMKIVMDELNQSDFITVYENIRKSVDQMEDEQTKVFLHHELNMLSERIVELVVQFRHCSQAFQNTPYKPVIDKMLFDIILKHFNGFVKTTTVDEVMPFEETNQSAN